MCRPGGAFGQRPEQRLANEEAHSERARERMMTTLRTMLRLRAFRQSFDAGEEGGKKWFEGLPQEMICAGE